MSVIGIAPRVKETSTTTGTGTFDLDGAETGFQTFVAGAGDGEQVIYYIVQSDLTQWETGVGTITDAAPDTLSRDTIIANSSGDTSKINFAAGTKDVFIGFPMDKTYATKMFGLLGGTIRNVSSGNVTVSAGDRGTFINVSTNTVSSICSLPNASAVGENFPVGFSKRSSQNSLIIEAASSQTIDGSTRVTLANQYDLIWLVSQGGTSWQRLLRSQSDGDELLIAQNLADLNNVGSALVNLGIGSAGRAVFSAVTQASARAQLGMSTITSTEARAGTSSTVRAFTAQRVAEAINTLATLPKNYLTNYEIDPTAGSVGYITVRPGECRDATDAQDIALSASTSKQYTSTFTAGVSGGGLDASSITSNVWYHAHAILNSSSLAVDVLFSRSLASPSMPTGFDFSRRIGSFKTDSDASALGFVQNGDRCDWLDPPLDLDGAVSTTSELVPLSVPNGLVVTAIFNAAVVNDQLYISNPAVNDDNVSITSAPLTTIRGGAGGSVGHGPLEVLTDSSTNVRANAGSNVTVRIATIGWKDRRGK